VEKIGSAIALVGKNRKGDANSAVRILVSDRDKYDSIKKGTINL
jgi:hypothetical protein